MKDHIHRLLEQCIEVEIDIDCFRDILALLPPLLDVTWAYDPFQPEDDTFDDHTKNIVKTIKDR